MQYEMDHKEQSVVVLIPQKSKEIREWDPGVS